MFLAMMTLVLLERVETTVVFLRGVFRSMPEPGNKLFHVLPLTVGSPPALLRIGTFSARRFATMIHACGWTISPDV